MGYVYIFVSPSGKPYIGKTMQEPVEKRFKQHRYNAYEVKRTHKAKFYTAIRKYGFDSFSSDILSATDDPVRLGELEKLWICLLDTQTNGYNLTSGGEGYAPGDETRRKMSASQTGRVPWNKGLKGSAKHSEEWKRTHSERMSGVKNPFYGKTHDEETRKRMSEKRTQTPLKTHCKHGHAFAVYGKVGKNGYRYCNLCQTIRNKARYTRPKSQ